MAFPSTRSSLRLETCSVPNRIPATPSQKSISRSATVDSTHDLNRRKFLKHAAILGAAPLFPGGRMPEQQPHAEQVPSGVVPKKQLGHTGVQDSALGLAGYHLGSVATDRAALEIIAKALDQSINSVTNCW